MKKKRILCAVFISFIAMCVARSLVAYEQKPFGEKILLIINFNHPYYKNIRFFQDVYAAQFPHMVFYGEREAQGVEYFSTQAGAFAYGTLADAMRKHPDYDGYLWINDDCGIVMSRIMHFDTAKIWAPTSGFGPYGKGLIDLRDNGAHTSWEWWHSQYGLMPAAHVYQELSDEQRSRLHANKNSWEAPYGMAEAFYIPQHYREDAIALAELCYKHRLWIEIAFPWIIDCLERAEKRQELAILWGEDFSSAYKEVDFFHPIKLSSPENQEFMKNVFNEAI